MFTTLLFFTNASVLAIVWLYLSIISFLSVALATTFHAIALSRFWNNVPLNASTSSMLSNLPAISSAFNQFIASWIAAFTLLFRLSCNITICLSKLAASYSNHNVLIDSLSVSNLFRFLNTVSASVICFDIASIFTADCHGCPCDPRYAILCFNLSRSSAVFLMVSLDCSWLISHVRVSTCTCNHLCCLWNSSSSLFFCIYSACVNAMSCPT